MAAATDTSQKIAAYSPQDVLSEVRNFLHGANHKVQNIRQRESLSQSALVLLRTLPTARHAVLEYIANVFDEAVNNYLIELDVGQSMNDGSNQAMDRFLYDSCGILHSFIQTNPAGWAPILSMWSLDLLGHVSSKYSDRRGVPHVGSLNELLQLWLTCKPTKLLIEVATQCFSQLLSGESANCVDALLEASVKYSPHFDWVVAHIGSAFPKAIISRVLLCGLKDYSHHGGSHGNSSDMDANIPKMGSVVGILGHLAGKHGHSIRDALMKLFKDSLMDQGRLPTLPFLLQLASMSPMLLHILATDLIVELDIATLNQLHAQLQLWRAKSPAEFESMMSLVLHLVLQNSSGAEKVLQFLLTSAIPEKAEDGETSTIHPEVQQMCGLLIEQVLNETQVLVYRRQDASIDLPYLGSLCVDISTLTHQLLLSNGKRCEWLRRLVCYIILYKGAKVGAETLAYILAHAQTDEQLSQFVRIQQSVESACGHTLLEGCVQCVMDRLHHHSNADRLHLLANLYTLAAWEQGPGSNVIRSTLRQTLQAHWGSIASLLVQEDRSVAITALKLLNYIASAANLATTTGTQTTGSGGNPAPGYLATNDALMTAGALVALFFSLMDTEDTREADRNMVACKTCAKYLAHTPFIQAMLVRYLIEGAVAEENQPMLGQRLDPSISIANQEANVNLRKYNKQHGVSLTMLRSHSTVFHAGVIGQGLRPKSTTSRLLESLVLRNQVYLEEMLWVCCSDNQANRDSSSTESPSTLKSFRLTIGADLCRTIGSLITELTTPDVLYNNRFWPEEESLKMTVERDLHVWKCFDDNPVLYRIMEMLASNALVMSRCSAVLKSLTATMMHHFELSREKSATVSQKHMDCCLCIIHCLGKSGLLPQPLCLVTELIPHVTPYEVFLILLSVWRYMKENPPTEDPSEVSRRACEWRHIETVKALLHKNIHVTGDLFARFVQPIPAVKQEQE